MYLGRSPTIGTQRLLDSIESQFNGTLTTFDLRYGGVPTYPTLSAGLLVSLGGVLQEPSEAYYVSSDKIVLSEAPVAGTECWILLYSEFGAAQSGAGEAAIAATGEPMGFENRPHSTISFASNTRTFSIAPNTAAGHSSYAVWTKGTRRTYSVAQSVQIGTTTGLYYIYFDAFGDLLAKTTYFTWDTETPVAYVYWNSATGSAPFIADERHGIVLDWATHEYLHRTRGAVIAEGFSISAYTTTGDGSADAHAQFDLGNGTFFDEDLEVAISHSATPTVGTFTQVLTGAAEIPVFFLSGSSGAWVRDTPTEYACKQSGTTLQYNLLTGSTWSTTPATNNRYVVSWVVATNDITAPIIAILGQEQYTAIGSAEATRFGDLVLTNFPIVEFRPLWKVIFQTSTSFTNIPNARVANILDLRQLSETGEGGTVVSDHGLMSGLADDDHSQYLHASLDRAGVGANISTTGNLGGANLTLTGQLQGPANFIIDPAVVGDDTGTVEIKGNLTVQGLTTTINSTTLTVDDKNIVLGDTASPTDALADGGGIVLKGSTDKTIAWLDGTDAWTVSEHVSIASAKEYRIAGTKVLDATGLGSGVLGSSLTSVGTIASGTWQGTAIADTYLGTIATAGKVSNSATTATSALGINTIVARDASNNFTAGTITAALTGAASSNVLKAGDTMTGALVLPLGAFGTPSLTFTSDLNTGIFSPGADQVAISTGGTAKFTVGSLDGNPIIENNFPTVRPALDLAFAATKRLDPRVTFVRATSATYVGGDGLVKTAGVNEARFDHDPYTGESLGLLVEESRTNLVTYSEGFDDANWTKARTTVTANATTAPDGTLTADRLLETATTDTFYVGKFYDTSTPGTYTASVFAKGDGSGRLLNFVLYQGKYQQSYFNLTTGVVSNVSAELTASIQSLPNGWFRCSVTGTSVSFTTSLFYIAAAAGENSVSVTRPGSASAGIYLWGAQLEAGAFPTSYIPTSGSTVTRSADVASMTGTNFSSWYNQSEGTLLWKGIFDSYNSSGSNDALFAITDGTANNRFSIRPRNTLATSPGNTLFESFDWGYTVQSNTYMNGALAIKSGDYALVTSGIVRNTSSSSSVPQVNRIENFNSIEGGYSVTGIIHHQRITYYPKRLTNQQLQALTT